MLEYMAVYRIYNIFTLSGLQYFSNIIFKSSILVIYY